MFEEFLSHIGLRHTIGQITQPMVTFSPTCTQELMHYCLAQARLTPCNAQGGCQRQQKWGGAVRLVGFRFEGREYACYSL
jgi:hypothetical protein